MLNKYEYLRDLLWALTLKELKGRYKSTTLGFLWMFLNPLLQMGTLTLVSSFFLKVSVPNYPLFALSGLVPWTFFSMATTAGTSSLISNRELLKKVRIPSIVLPISAVLSHAINFFLSLGIVTLISIIFTMFSIKIILVLLLAILLTILIASLSILLSSLDIYYRDVSFILQAGLIIWFYMTPIFYPWTLVPSRFLLWYSLNPLVGIITAFQTLLWNGSVPPNALLISIIETLILGFLSVIIFKRKSAYFADWI